MAVLIYLDNAATSFPKPAECFAWGWEEYLSLGASPGRGGYDAALRAAARVEAIRRQVSAFFGGDGYLTCFSSNATDALNTLIGGLVKPTGHVVSTRLEHNSVLRPLHHLRTAGRCTVDLVPFGTDGLVDPAAIAGTLKPNTCLVVLNHASNVLGTVQPVAEIARICQEREIPLVLDASQSAGSIPVDLEAWGVDAMAFTGHKSLLGPTGIGGLVFRPDLDIRPTRFGGTGVDSASLVQTPDYPERLEAGTINLLGILTLSHCLDYLESQPGRLAVESEAELYRRLVARLQSLAGLSVHCPGSAPDRVPLVSCNLEGWLPTDVGAVLDGDFGIAVRTGLHCAPLVHEDLGTGGSVRISLSPSTTADEVDALIEALSLMLGSA